MKPEQQRIAIAEACGWKIISNFGSGVVYGQNPNYPSSNQVPDYLNDLNAMHEAELTLLKSDCLLWHRYASFLDSDYVNQPYTVGATAAQRAEALLRTLNLWKE